MIHSAKHRVTILSVAIVLLFSACSINNNVIKNRFKNINIDGSIIIGEGIGEIGEEFADLNEGNDTLVGSAKNDLMFGGRGNDTLYGENGIDFIYGEKGDDILSGNDMTGSDDKTADYLAGGKGYDIYLANNQDMINDSDGNGIIFFEKDLLTGGNKISNRLALSGNTFRGDGGLYSLSRTTLKFTKYSGETLIIKNFINGALGITLLANDFYPLKPSPIQTGPNKLLPELFDDRNLSIHSKARSEIDF